MRANRVSRDRISANLLKGSALHNAVWSVEPQQAHNGLSHLRERLNNSPVKLEMIAPGVLPGIE
jgi:hypothetical protein